MRANRRCSLPALKMSEKKVVIKNADMDEEVQQVAVENATRALEKYNVEKDIAAFIKREFDKKYGATWHCVVGRNFGSYMAFLLFKSG
ncbi:MAG: dynein light chain 2, cytoplasmic-like protein [Olpidium bornovanus]|uniref:Dynein light chain n=1 Tax=Olpidium bornovanus TaxID=278681 RepID=A0A8H7ZTU0_9FUNG|nr:MAG: dynein light chain 2, cytoplasmic-like protein [Olpidium bornovanus]